MLLEDFVERFCLLIATGISDSGYGQFRQREKVGSPGHAEGLQIFNGGQPGVFFEQGTEIASVQAHIPGHVLNPQGFMIAVLYIADDLGYISIF